MIKKGSYRSYVRRLMSSIGELTTNWKRSTKQSSSLMKLLNSLS